MTRWPTALGAMRCSSRSHAPADRIAAGTSAMVGASYSRSMRVVRSGPLARKWRPRADPFDLAFDLARELRGPVPEQQLELDAGRARVDDENAVHRSHAAGNGEVLRRASA
jgi:hypothetical protein